MNINLFPTNKVRFLSTPYENKNAVKTAPQPNAIYFYKDKLYTISRMVVCAVKNPTPWITNVCVENTQYAAAKHKPLTTNFIEIIDNLERVLKTRKRNEADNLQNIRIDTNITLEFNAGKSIEIDKTLTEQINLFEYNFYVDQPDQVICLESHTKSQQWAYIMPIVKIKRDKQ